jgi:hypothetical protein
MNALCENRGFSLMGAIYTTILHEVRNELGITNNEYVFLDAINKLSERDGVCRIGNAYLANSVGVGMRTVQLMIPRLVQRGLLKQRNRALSVTNLWVEATVRKNEKTSFNTLEENEIISPKSEKTSPKSEKSSQITDAIYTDNNKTNNDSDFGADLLELNKALGRTGRLLITKTRLSHLKARLKNFTVAELMVAAKAIGSNDFMKKGGHNTVDYLLRNDEKIEQWLGRTADKTETPF